MRIQPFTKNQALRTRYTDTGGVMPRMSTKSPA